MPHGFRLAPMLALAALTFATPACAQGFFDMIFNGDRYAPRPSRGYAPPQGSAYADPSNPSDRPVYAPSGGGAAGRAMAAAVAWRIACGCATAVISRSSGARAPIRRRSASRSARPPRRRSSRAAESKTRFVTQWRTLRRSRQRVRLSRQARHRAAPATARTHWDWHRVDARGDPTLRAGDIVATGRGRPDGLSGRQAGTPGSSRQSTVRCCRRNGVRRQLSERYRSRLSPGRVRRAIYRFAETRAASREPSLPIVYISLLFQLPHHLLGDRQRRGEAGRFDPEQMHQSRQAVLGRAVDQEVRGRLALPVSFGRMPQ